MDDTETSPIFVSTTNDNTTTTQYIMATLTNIIAQAKVKISLSVKAMNLAWKVYRQSYKAIGKTFAEALKHAWAKVLLTAALKKPMTVFSFVKKSTGETVTRTATQLSITSKPRTWTVEKAATLTKNWFIVRFYDATKQGWRSCDCRTLVAIH
ncbi:MAG: hypothetical protein HRU05_00910 [Oceanospirillaceae bacterium]|nr:hypothetical protein [Oceanospirillaceae bacterium]